MTYSSDLEIEHIAKGVMALSLPKAEWTHAAHFAAAVWMLEDPDIDPFADMPGYIRAYNLATGVANTENDGYHETITLASLGAARHFLSMTADDISLHGKVNALLTTDYGQPDWVLSYWSKEKLFSPEARKTWCAPDKQVLPFD